MSTQDHTYASYLADESWWKKVLDVQRPYRWNLNRLNLGFTLDIGCGVGRHLWSLDGIGIDHNEYSVGVARVRGMRAYTPSEFRASPYNVLAFFDSLLLSHVVEHMTLTEATELLRRYLYLLKPKGRVILITPQEAGFRSDPTHVEFIDFDGLKRIAEQNNLRVEREYSFPFPRFAGRLFRHNEFVIVCRKD